MRIVKLDAIDSTNDYLKAIIAEGEVENYTVITAETQTKGRGQMGAEWVSEPGKNLIMSLLIKDSLLDIKSIYNLNIATALGIITALKKFNISNLSIKWPNDILSDNKKIGGILIENTIKPNGGIISVIGIGLNVNQQDFANLPKASSLSIIMKKEFDKEEILYEIIERIKSNVTSLINTQSEKLWEDYNSCIFKKGVPMPFESENNRFMGIIQNVSKDGKLQLLLEDDSVSSFGIKEIQMLY